MVSALDQQQCCSMGNGTTISAAYALAARSNNNKINNNGNDNQFDYRTAALLACVTVSTYPRVIYSTVTLLARLRGKSTSIPLCVASQ